MADSSSAGNLEEEGRKDLASLSHVSLFRAGQGCAGMWGGNPHEAAASCNALWEQWCEIMHFVGLVNQSTNLLPTAGFNKFLWLLFRSSRRISLSLYNPLAAHFEGWRAQPKSSQGSKVLLPFLGNGGSSSLQDREPAAMFFACGEGCAVLGNEVTGASQFPFF